MSNDPYMACTLRENIDRIAVCVGASSDPEIKGIKQDVLPEQVLGTLEDKNGEPAKA